MSTLMAIVPLQAGMSRQGETSPGKTGPESGKEVARELEHTDQQDTTDIYAIPLDNSEEGQDEEMEMLEQKQKPLK